MKTPGSPQNPSLSSRESALVDALKAIVVETMAYPPVAPQSADSYLPEDMILAAIRALGGCGVLVMADCFVVEG